MATGPNIAGPGTEGVVRVPRRQSHHLVKNQLQCLRLSVRSDARLVGTSSRGADRLKKPLVSGAKASREVRHQPRQLDHVVVLR
jgi:hypothetical protein